MAERFITPLESKQLTSPHISEPIRFNHEYGRVQKIGEDLSANLLKMYEESKANLKASYMSDYQREINEFESKLQYDKSYYQDPSKIAELKERLQLKKDEFTKMAEDMEFFSEDMDEINNATDTLNLRVETAYKTKYVNWREQEIKEDYLAEQLQKAQNNRTTMMLGYRENAVNDFHSTVKSFEKGINNDYLTEENAIKDSLGDRLDLITANVMSYTNKENAMAIYEQMSKMTFEEFRESYKDTIFKLNGKNYDLTDMEYEAFKRAIDNGARSLRIRQAAEQLNLKVDAAKRLKKERDEPVETSWETLRLTADERIADRPDSIVLATNYKYGTNFEFTGDYKEDAKTLQLINDLGLEIPTIDKNSYYNNVKIMNESQYIDDGYNGLLMDFEEAALGFEDEVAENIMNSRTNPKDFACPVGYRVAKAYQNYENTNNLVNSIYTPQFRQVLIENKNLKFDVSGAMELYEKDRESELYRTGDFSTSIVLQNDTKQRYNMTTSGKLRALKLNSKNDVNTGRLYTDLRDLRNDLALNMIYNKTEGIVPEKFLDNLSSENNKLPKGTTINELGADKKATLFRLIASDDDFKKELDERFKPVFNEVTEGLGFLDVGNGQMLVVSEKHSSEIEAKGIRDFIQGNKFTDSQGRIVPKKGVIAKGYLNKDSCTFAFEGQPLYIKGKLAVYTFGEGDKK